MNLGLNKREVILKKYSELWKNEFEIESILLKEILHDFEMIIEHIGSTSISNMEAKPIVDILIGMKSGEQLKDVRIVLKENSYFESEI